MLNSSEYQHVTYGQIDDMKHAIGFDPRKVTGTKHRKYVPYRNYYAAGGDRPDLDELVRLGFMEKSRPGYYHVTNDGKLFLEKVTGVKIMPDLR